MCTRPNEYPMPSSPQYNSTNRARSASGSRIHVRAAASVKAPPKPSIFWKVSDVSTPTAPPKPPSARRPMRDSHPPSDDRRVSHASAPAKNCCVVRPPPDPFFNAVS